MSKPIYTIEVWCLCKTKLYRYQKEGPGSLVKCYKDRIIEDNTKGDLKCPNCGKEFARPITLHGRAANKIIQSRVYTKGHCPK